MYNRNMLHTRSIFRSLAWKLTFSYTAVTVMALLVVEIAALGFALYLIARSDIIPNIVVEAIANSAGELVPYLDEDPPDINGIESWLERINSNGFAANNAEGRRVSFFPNSLGGDDGRVSVYGPQKQLLATIPAEEGNQEPVNLVEEPELNNLLNRALQGEEEPRNLYQRTADNLLAVVAPVKNNQGHVLGVLSFTGTYFDTQEPYRQILPILGTSLLVFTLAAGAVGTLFGFLTARGLTRRLHTVSEAAEAWSRGDFTVVVRDRSGDEIGQLSQRLNLMAEQLQNLMQTRQELASIEERNRLARDLHDSVKQQVFAAGMQVGAARAMLDRDPHAADMHLLEAEKLARQAQLELTGLIRELRPANLQGQGLAEALKGYVEDWSRSSGIPAQVHVQGQRPLPLQLEQTLYRVAQEALSNVARHSGAHQVDLRLAWQDDQVILEVSDNGRGFNPTERKDRGVGMASMHERVEGLNGQLKIDSTPGKGTRVKATIPLVEQSLQPADPKERNQKV